MITKRNFSPFKVWQYIKYQMTFVLLWSTAVWLLFKVTGAKELAINFTPVGVLGSALAIFVAFRNNSSYSRWWEARSLWSGILGAGRTLGRLVITFTDSHSHQVNYDKNRSENFKKALVYKIIAWAHLLRMQLRKEKEYPALKKYLSDEEYNTILKVHNKPSMLHLHMGRQIYEAMANGTLGGFDSFQMEAQLLALTNHQAGCERIKSTPLPRQYDFFTRVFVIVFAAALPFGLLSFFSGNAVTHLSWIIIPLSFVVAGVFVIMERTGAANEDPFENKVTDVPMTYICNTLERDLLEMLGEKELPEKMEPVKGYLF